MNHLFRSEVALTLVAVLDEERRLRLALASVVLAGFNPSTLANKFKTSVKLTTPCNLPIINPGVVAPSGGVCEGPTGCIGGGVCATGRCGVAEFIGDTGTGAIIAV
jgi:hypothetical protein